jgi:hypothetical protein
MIDREPDDEQRLLRAVAIQNANAILVARRRAEQDLLEAKEALEEKTAALAHSLSMVRATLEASTDGILVTDEHGRVTDFIVWHWKAHEWPTFNVADIAVSCGAIALAISLWREDARRPEPESASAA